jgi:hypothetical protein
VIFLARPDIARQKSEYVCQQSAVGGQPTANRRLPTIDKKPVKNTYMGFISIDRIYSILI